MTKVTNLFFDLEFTGLHRNTTIVSLGIVADSGQTFYAEFTDYDKSQVDEWLQTNVIDKTHYLQYSDDYSITFNTKNGKEEYHSYGDTNEIKKALIEWLAQFESITIIGDVLAYDWVLFQSIFGTAFDMPSHINYIPIDVATLFWVANHDVDVNREEYLVSKYAQLTFPEGNKHNALYDAIITKSCYNTLLIDMKEQVVDTAKRVLHSHKIKWEQEHGIRSEE